LASNADAMAKSPFEIVLSGEERAELARRVACYTLPFNVVQRAKMILYAADGLSNAEIARRLFISEKTAGHHVSAILQKLDAGSRGEAAVAARKIGISAPPT